MPLENWDEVRTAYQVARLGTVSGAAEVLGVHHATVIRHVDALEKRLGAKLFQRHARGYTATEAGRDLLLVAQATDDQFTQLAGRLRGRGAEMTGELIVTSLSGLAPLLTPSLVRFQADHPELIVRFLTDERLFRLEYGEAHVAIRAGAAPDQPDNVVQRFIGQSGALYAAEAYVARFGRPKDETDLAGHRFVCSDNEASRAPFDLWIRARIPADQIVFRATEQSVLAQAVLAGAGIGFLPCWQADRQDGLVQMLPPRDDWASQLWLVTHVDLHRTAKVQAFTAFLKAEAADRGRVLIRRLSPAAQGHLAMLCFSALVAGSFLLGSRAANELAPIALNAARFVLAGVVVGTMAAAFGRFPRRLPPAPWRFAVLGALFAGYFVLMFEGLKTASSVSTAAAFTLTPMITAVLGWLILQQVITGRMALALTVGACGALWVIFRADISALLALEVGRGEVIYFVGCCLHAAYTVLLKALNRDEAGVVVVFFVLVSGALAMTVFGWPAIAAAPWGALPAIVWVTIGYTAVFSGAITFWLLQLAAQRIPGAKVMAYTYLTPSWVIAVETIAGRGAPPVAVLAGVGLSVAALLMLLKDEGH